MAKTLIAILLAFTCLTSCDRDERKRSDIDVGPFGKVALYRNSDAIRNIVVYFSDARGWREDFDDEAWGVAWPDRVVAGVDLPRLTQNLASGAQCVDYAGAVKRLTDAISTHLKISPKEEPFFLGQEDGASVAYAAGVQSAPNKVQGVVTMDFCPVLHSPLPPCPGQGSLQTTQDGSSFMLQSSKALSAAFVTIADPAKCTAADIAAFTGDLPDGRIVVPQPDQATDLLVSVVTQTNARTAASAAVPVAALPDLPIIELPATGNDDRLAIVLSGDGGWADIDKDIGERLSKQGIGVVGFNSLKYFWSEQTPEKATADLERILRHYLAAWNKSRVVLVGFSFGADVLPFLYQRLPADLKARTDLMTLLAPSLHTSFEVSVGGWIGVENTSGPEMAPAIAALDVPTLCVENTEEDERPCPGIVNPKLEVMTLEGDHHFDRQFAPIAARIAAKSREPKN